MPMPSLNALSINVVLIGVTAVVSMLALSRPAWIEALLLRPTAVSRDRQHYRLLTYGFVHADVGHLALNMITLYFFGPAMEQEVGRHFGAWGYLGFYLAALVMSALPSYQRHRDDPDYRTLGASGAVSAVLFGFVLLRPTDTLYLYFALPIKAWLFALLYTAYSVWANHRGGDRINHNAHLAGAAFGVMCMLLLEPASLGRFLRALGLG